VAELYVQGAARKQIADILSVSENTIKNQIAAVYKKLQATGKLDLARRLGRLQ
jgi:DNA-binding NarL/FixJ family response regulator